MNLSSASAKTLFLCLNQPGWAKTPADFFAAIECTAKLPPYEMNTPTAETDARVVFETTSAQHGACVRCLRHFVEQGAFAPRKDNADLLSAFGVRP